MWLVVSSHKSSFVPSMRSWATWYGSYFARPVSAGGEILEWLFVDPEARDRLADWEQDGQSSREYNVLSCT